MSYRLSGHFIESCDCTVICPCWVDDDPVGGHCTGFIAWEIKQGEAAVVDGIPVEGCRVVSVATHSGNRRDGSSTTTMLYIDVPEASVPGGSAGTAAEPAPPDDAAAAQPSPPAPHRQFAVLVELFSGHLDGPLAELAQVSGNVVGARRARIEIGADCGGEAKDSWRVTVRPSSGPSQSTVVEATGHPAIFDADRGNTEPLTLARTAISYELKALDPVIAQHGDRLFVNVGALPAGNLEVTGRSGMRGEFRYDYVDRGRVPPPQREGDPT